MCCMGEGGGRSGEWGGEGGREGEEGWGEVWGAFSPFSVSDYLNWGLLTYYVKIERTVGKNQS